MKIFALIVVTSYFVAVNGNTDNINGQGVATGPLLKPLESIGNGLSQQVQAPFPALLDAGHSAARILGEAVPFFNIGPAAESIVDGATDAIEKLGTGIGIFSGQSNGIGHEVGEGTGNAAKNGVKETSSGKEKESSGGNSEQSSQKSGGDSSQGGSTGGSSGGNSPGEGSSSSDDSASAASSSSSTTTTTTTTTESSSSSSAAAAASAAE